MALLYTRWKVIFQEQRNEGFKIWSELFVKLRAPTLINLRADPFEKGPMGAIYYSDWQAHRMFAFVPARGEMDLELQRVPAAAEAGQLQHRCGDAEVGGSPQQEVRRFPAPEW